MFSKFNSLYISMLLYTYTLYTYTNVNTLSEAEIMVVRKIDGRGQRGTFNVPLFFIL